MNIEEIKHLAQLSSLELNSEQMEQLTVELDNIFQLVGKLQSVDTSQVAPLFHPIAMISELSQPLRRDEVTEVNNRENNIKTAPASFEGLYLVPKVIE
jgi:aspartyl-tRNA(Asn)/glutamyl-tRNA(Gln) amidotransferase subunit C